MFEQRLLARVILSTVDMLRACRDETRSSTRPAIKPSPAARKLAPLRIRLAPSFPPLSRLPPVKPCLEASNYANGTEERQFSGPLLPR